MTTHLELDVLECEVQWTIGSVTTNKASGSDRITAELLKFFKDDAVKCCTQHVNNWKVSSGHRNGKGQFSFQYQKRAMPKNVQTTVQPHSFHMLARLHSKSFKLDFCSMGTKNIQMIQAGFQRGTRGQIVSIHWMVEKARQFQKKKKIYVCFTDSWKAFDCLDPNKTVENSWDENTRPPYLPPEKAVCGSRSNS